MKQESQNSVYIGAATLVWCQQVSPALLPEALPYKAGVPSLVTLLPSHHGNGNLSIGILSHL